MINEGELLNRIPKLKKELCNKQIEREDVVSMLIVTFFANKNMFLLGEPGVSKTGILEIFATILSDGKVFDWTIKDDTKFEELFGDRYRDDSGKMIYNTSDSIIDAHITILDEIWKGNSKILNSLLSATSNYRVVEIRGEGRIKIPNLSTFAASNELPTDKSLKALKDRFNVMMNVEAIKDNDNWLRFISQDYDTVPTLNTTFTLEEVEYINRKSSEIKIDKNRYELLLKLKNSIKTMKISCSDRRFAGSTEILKVSAFLNKRDAVEIIDLFLLVNMIWEIESDIKEVNNLVFELIFGNLDDVRKLVIVNDNALNRALSIQGGKLSDFLKFRYSFSSAHDKSFETNIKLLNLLIDDFHRLLDGYNSIYSHYNYNMYLEKEIEKHLFLPNYKSSVYHSDIINIDKIQINIKLIEKEIINLKNWLVENSQIYIYNNKVNKS